MQISNDTELLIAKDMIEMLKAHSDEIKRIEDNVKTPSHYCYSKYQPKDVIREWGLNFNLGNAVKYIVRAGRKDDIIQDLMKAREYIEFEIEYLQDHRCEDE